MCYMKMPQMKWLLLIVLNMLLVTPFAADPGANQAAITSFAKILGLYYLIICIVQNKMHYKLFIWVQVWGNFLLGWHAFTRGKFTGGRLENIGVPGARGSNLVASHLLLILPFVGTWVLFGSKWERLAAIVAAPFVINALILCRSRGAFLAIAVMGLVAGLLAKKGVRVKIVVGLLLGGILFVQLTDPGFWTRIRTIKTYQQEGSAMGRIASWKRAIDMIGDYPLGKGGGGWEAYSPIYIPEIVASHRGQRRTVHNTFLMMATDWGIQGLFCLVAFLIGTIRELHRIRKRRGTNDDQFYHLESMTIEIAIIGFLVGATFLNRIYAEGFYWYCALTTALSNIQQSELLEIAKNLDNKVS